MAAAPLGENAFVGILLGGIAALILVALVIQSRRAKKLAAAEVLEVPLSPSPSGMFKAVGSILLLIIGSALALVFVMVQAKNAGFEQWPLLLAGGIIVIGAAVVAASLRITLAFSQGRLRYRDGVLEVHAPEERYQQRVFSLSGGTRVRFWGSGQIIGCDVDDEQGGVTLSFQGLTVADFQMGKQAPPSIRGVGFAIDRVAGRELFRRISRVVQAQG